MNWPDYPTMFYPAVVLAVLLTGISKGGFVGSGGFAVPIMSIFIAPGEAAGIMLPLLCGMDLFSAYAYRHTWSRQHLKILLSGSLIGIALGGLAFGTLPVNAVRLIVGLIAVLFTMNKVFGLTEKLARRLSARARPPGRMAGVFWGGVSGFTSTLAHAGGPPFAVYMLPQKIDKTLLVGTSVMFFFIGNYVKLIPYYFLGQLKLGNLATSLLFAPLVPLGVWIGIWLHRRISEHTFYAISYALLFLAGAKLIYDALIH